MANVSNFSDQALSSIWKGKHTKFTDSNSDGSSKIKLEEDEENNNLRPLWKGTHTVFDEYGNVSSVSKNAPRANSKWVDSTDKYFVTPTPGIPIQFKCKSMSSSSQTRSVSPDAAISRDYSKHEVILEVAQFAISNYNTRHKQTKFEVVDVMSLRQTLLPGVIRQLVTFTAKDVESNPCALRAFVSRVIIHRPRNVREVEFCNLQEWVD